MTLNDQQQRRVDILIRLEAGYSQRRYVRWPRVHFRQERMASAIRSDNVRLLPNLITSHSKGRR